MKKTTEVIDPIADTPAPRTPEQLAQLAHDFDMEGLMTDFPNATELQKFVYDQTGIVLNLKGRANRIKYQVALDTLNGIPPSAEFTGSENPYVDKNDLIPVDAMKEIPERSQEIIEAGPMITSFMTRTFPHPDPEWKSTGQKCDVVFRKYFSGVITYEILGPIAPRAVGSRVNKFGQSTPERYSWVDPRTGEQVIRTARGGLTAIGTRLRAYMQAMMVNKSNAWDTWIDREFVVVSGNGASDSPWDL